MKSTKIITLVLLLILVVGGFTWANSQKSKESIKIGGLYPLTGGLSSYGEPARNVALIAIEDINMSGGINGSKLELVIEDHKCDPKEATSVFQKLYDVEKVRIFTSVACSGTALALAPSLASKEALLLGTITSTPKLTGVSPYFFRNWASDAREARLLADRVLEKGYKNIAVIHEETDYAKGLRIALEEYLKGTGVKITSESFASGATEVRSQLTKLQALKPDLVFVSVQTVPSGELVLTQMKQLQFKPAALFINDNILKASALVEKHKELLEGAVGGDYVIPETSQVKEVLTKYKAKYGVDCPQVNICAAEYDAIQMLAEGLREKGTTAKQMQNYLANITYNGVTGEISFDENNDRSNTHYSLFEIRDGKGVMIK